MYTTAENSNFNCTKTRRTKEKEMVATTTFHEKQRTPDLSTERTKENQL